MFLSAHFLQFWHFNYSRPDIKSTFFLPCKRKNNRFPFHFWWLYFTSESKKNVTQTLLVAAVPTAHNLRFSGTGRWDALLVYYTPEVTMHCRAFMYAVCAVLFGCLHVCERVFLSEDVMFRVDLQLPITRLPMCDISVKHHGNYP